MEKYSGEVNLIGWESVFPKTQKFSCIKCGSCCYADDIDVTNQDIQRIEGSTEFKERIFIENTKGMKRIKQNNGSCMFIKENLCSIHKFRPNTCRKFPYKVYFENPKKAYIDIVHSCPSVLLNESKENEIEFDKIVLKAHKRLLDSSLNVPFMGQIKERIFHNLDKKMAVDRVIDFLFSDVKNFFKIYKNIISINQNRPSGQLKFSLIEGLIQKAKNQKLNIDQSLFNEYSYDFVATNKKIRLYNLKIQKMTFILNDGTTTYLDKKYTKDDFIKLRYNLNETEMLKNYLGIIFNKKHMEYEVYSYVIEQLKKGNELSSLGFQLDVYERILSFMNFIFCILGPEINKEEMVSTIMVTDLYIKQMSMYVRRKYP